MTSAAFFKLITLAAKAPKTNKKLSLYSIFFNIWISDLIPLKPLDYSLHLIQLTEDLNYHSIGNSSIIIVELAASVGE